MNYLKVIAIAAMMALGTQVSIGQNQQSKTKQVGKEKSSSKKSLDLKEKPSSSNQSATSKIKNAPMSSKEQEMASIRQRLEAAKSNSK